MALNKRTTILLVIAVLVWILAIFVLFSTGQPAQQKAPGNNAANTSQSVQIHEQSTVSTTTLQSVDYATNTAFNTTNSFTFLTFEETNVTVPDIFEPYFIDLKKLTGKSKSEDTTVSLDQDSYNSRNNLKASSINQNIEDITSDALQYHGYVELSDGENKIRKLYITIGGETKSYNSEELIEGKYKVVDINSQYVVVLDTSDGKVKKISISK